MNSHTTLLSASNPVVAGEATSTNMPLNSSHNGLPRESGASLSYWLQGVRNNPLLDHRTTETIPSEAEVVIIGSGLSGVMVAHELLHSKTPPKSVLMLEAREFCSGATGRNAGNCKPDQWRGFGKHEKALGTEQAVKILMNERKNWQNLFEYINKEKVECDLWVGKNLDVATSEEVANNMANSLYRYKAAGGETEHIELVTDQAEAVKLSRIKSAVSVLSYDVSTLNPWKLTAHLVGKCLELGLNLQTWTPATSVTPIAGSPGKWNVVTDRGSVATSSIVHATNGYGTYLLPELTGIIRPTPQICDKVIPPRSWSGSKALQNSYTILCPEGPLFSINPRSTADGILLFGGNNHGQRHLLDYLEAHPEERTNDGLANFKPITESVKNLLQVEFEGWGTETSPGQGYEYSWSGIMGRSADGVSYVGKVPGKEGQWICAGHNGHGMSCIMTAAPGLVKLMQGGTWADTELPECFEITQERLDRLKSG